MIEITDIAKEKILEIAEKEDLKPFVRVGVAGGGCSGYQHQFFFDEKVQETDHTFEFDGVCVIIDMISMTYLEGITIDYIDGLMGAGFKFINPNATGTCGCGSSFAV
jgi:iron-sulfur cluster assembly accessory protein